MKLFFSIIYSFISITALCALLSGCTDDVISNGNTSDRVRFSVDSDSEWTEANSRAMSDAQREYASVTPSERNNTPGNFYLHALSEDNIEETDIPQSRGSSINSIDGQSISVTAFAFESWDNTLFPNFMIDEELRSPWETDRYWPNTGLKLQFFSHCPYMIEGWQRIVEAGYPKYSYQVPADAADQSDILVAWTPELSDKSKGEVSLNFKHALTRIKFTAAPDFETGTIHSITLKGVYGSGVFSFGDNDWSDLSAPADFVNQIDKEVTSAGGSLLSEELTFMMIPQSFTEDSQASVEIYFTDEITGTDHTLSFSLKGHQWNKGKTVNYRLSHNS